VDCERIRFFRSIAFCTRSGLPISAHSFGLVRPRSRRCRARSAAPGRSGRRRAPALRAEPHERGIHADRLVDHVEPRQPASALMIPCSHPACMSGSLLSLMPPPRRRGCRRTGASGRSPPTAAPARRPARHRAGPQVRHEGPGAEDRRMPGRHGVDIDHPGQAFGHRLHDGRGDAARAPWPRPVRRTGAGPACPRGCRPPS
jgi:hypothetical protein